MLFRADHLSSNASKMKMQSTFEFKVTYFFFYLLAITCLFIGVSGRYKDEERLIFIKPLFTCSLYWFNIRWVEKIVKVIC